MLLTNQTKIVCLCFSAGILASLDASGIQAETAEKGKVVSLVKLDIFESKGFEYQLSFYPKSGLLPEQVQLDFDGNGSVCGCSLKYPATVEYSQIRDAIRAEFGRFEQSYDTENRSSGLEYWTPSSPDVLITISSADSSGCCEVLILSREKRRDAEAGAIKGRKARAGVRPGFRFSTEADGREWCDRSE